MSQGLQPPPEHAPALAGLPLDPSDSRPHERDGKRQLPQDDVGLDAKHLAAEPAEIPISACVGGAPPAMLDSIHLNDKPERGRKEIRDGVAEDDLAPKTDTELSSGKLAPEQCLRCRRSVPIYGSASSEEVLTSGSG